MGQRRITSMVESAANISVGFVVAFIAQLTVFPIFNIAVTLADNFSIAGIFTLVSLVRSYALRRAFNWLGDKHGI